MHTIYTTEGIILKSVNFGEANKYFFIFTRNFGLVKAAAQGVRHLKSKLRYSLEDFSAGRVSLVRGKEIWRLTSAEKKLTVTEREKVLLLARIFSLLLRLLHGEEKNDFLFDSLKAGMDFLVQTDLTKETAGSFECIMALRILSALGYIGQLGEFDQFTASPYFTPDLLAAMAARRSQAIVEINKSLQETHL